jgi:hypothetical protein
MVEDSKKLRRNYAKSKYIYLDVFSILPTDIAYIFFDKSCHETIPCPVIFR